MLACQYLGSGRRLMQITLRHAATGRYYGCMYKSLWHSKKEINHVLNIKPLSINKLSHRLLHTQLMLNLCADYSPYYLTL